MNTNELKQKTTAELREELTGLLKEQFNLRMQKATGQLQRTHLLKTVRRNIARVKTLITEKEGQA